VCAAALERSSRTLSTNPARRTGLAGLRCVFEATFCAMARMTRSKLTGGTLLSRPDRLKHKEHLRVTHGDGCDAHGTLTLAPTYPEARMQP
jgi:hypothetical protein